MKHVFDYIVEHLQKKRDYLLLFSVLRMRSEGWLKGELVKCLFDLKSQHTVEDVQFEKKFCDLWFQTAGGEFWMQLKSFPTNYCGGGGKPITDFINSVKSDGQKVLKLMRESGGSGLVFQVAYPFCEGERERQEWQKHVESVEAAQLKIANTAEISLGELNNKIWKAKIHLFASATRVS